MADARRTTAADPEGESALVTLRRLFLNQLLLPVVLVVMLLGFYAFEPRVLSAGNLNNILQQASYLFIFALAQMCVIVTRGFDLSIGTNVSSVSVLSALVMTGMAVDDGASAVTIVLAGVLTGIGFGILVGLFNGFVVAWLRVSPFIATLGSLNICLGVATMSSDGRPVFNVPDSFSQLFYSGTLFGIDAPIVYAIVFGVLIYLLMTRTVLGRALYLIGSNPRASDVAGMPTRQYLTIAYILCAVLAAIGSLLLTARTGSGEPNLGGGLRLVGESIAAAVIGGVSLRGGVGGVEATLVGALFITVLSNGMNLIRVDGYIQMVVLGAVLILAIFLDRLRRR